VHCHYVADYYISIASQIEGKDSGTKRDAGRNNIL
jgi:hypothetical protein